jgi:hypothetical protein
VSYQVYLPPASYQAARQRAADRGLTFSAYARDLIEADLDGRTIHAPAGTHPVAAGITDTHDGYLNLAVRIAQPLAPQNQYRRHHP